MRLKLDENLGSRTQQVFREAGYDVETVQDEGLRGSSDGTLYDLCRAERRYLVTLDLDFSDVVRFPPAGGSGILIFRAPRNLTLLALEAMARQVVAAAASMQPQGCLWIVEAGRIRVYAPESDESS